MALFTSEELEDLRRADAEVEKTFRLTDEEAASSRKRDADARLARKSGQKQRKAANNRSYYKSHREERLAYQNAYYRANREKEKARNLEYKKRRKAMATPRMTIKEVADDMRRRGMGMAYKTIGDGIASGKLPFGTIINTGETGRRTFLILRRDYEVWADRYMGA